MLGLNASPPGGIVEIYNSGIRFMRGVRTLRPSETKESIQNCSAGGGGANERGGMWFLSREGGREGYA